MARTPAPGTRDRILDKAGRLFLEHGARAVGMQQIIDECGCGKSLVYREFPSKDDLVVAYLERCQLEWAELMHDATARYADDPAAQLVAVVGAAVQQVSEPDYHGCAFRVSHAQYPDRDHPANKAVVRHMKRLRTQLRVLARRANADDPDALADRIMLIIDGVYSNGAILGRKAAAATAVAFAEEVVSASTGSPATSEVGR